MGATSSGTAAASPDDEEPEIGAGHGGGVAGESGVAAPDSASAATTRQLSSCR